MNEAATQRGLRRALQAWALAVGVSIGQLGATSMRPMHAPPAYVRMLPERRAGFAAAEVVGERIILTVTAQRDQDNPSVWDCPN